MDQVSTRFQNQGSQQVNKVGLHENLNDQIDQSNNSIHTTSNKGHKNMNIQCNKLGGNNEDQVNENTVIIGVHENLKSPTDQSETRKVENPTEREVPLLTYVTKNKSPPNKSKSLLKQLAIFFLASIGTSSLLFNSGGEIITLQPNEKY